MSGEKTTTQSSTTAQATPEEKAMEQIQLQRLQANQGNQQQLDTNMYNTMNTVLQGGSLPGNLSGITGINATQTQDMVNASLRDVMPQFQSDGIMDSGAAAQIATRTSADVRNQNSQFNVQAIQQLFNQALGGSSNLSSNTTQQNSVLGGQLAGLRTTNTSGSTIGMNPFLKSAQQNLGNNLDFTKWAAAMKPTVGAG